MTSHASKFIVLGVVLVLLGCGSDSPPERDARATLANLIVKISEGRAELVHFEKMDGVATEIFGIKHYMLFYSGRIRFKEDAAWSLNMSILKKRLSIAAQRSGWEAVQKGQELTVSGALTFGQSESGWHFTDHDVSQVKRYNRPPPSLGRLE